MPLGRLRDTYGAIVLSARSPPDAIVRDAGPCAHGSHGTRMYVRVLGTRYAEPVTDANEPPKPSSAWDWPAEWAVERAFWREVATRTIAGVLTLIILGVPVLIWTAFTGVLTWDQVAPILIGIGMAVLFLLLYRISLRIVKRTRRRRVPNPTENRIVRVISVVAAAAGTWASAFTLYEWFSSR